MQLSIIIVNYNGLRFFKDCLDSIFNNLKDVQFEIIIWDNNSTDDSCNYIKSNFKNVKLIESKINLGFGKGNNEAIKHSKGKYILLLNNDTILLEDISGLIYFMEQNQDIGALGINMLNDKREYLNAAGNFPNIFNLFKMRFSFYINNEFKKGKFKKKFYEVDWLTGSFILMPRIVFEEINGFDQDYFLYVEDVDLCKRIRKKNYRVIFIPSLSYIHFVGFNKSKNRFLIDGYRIFIAKHYSGYYRLFCNLALSVNSFIKKVKL